MNTSTSNMTQKELIDLKDHLKANWKKYLIGAAILGAGAYAGEPGRLAMTELIKVISGS
jgi:hypothetical protein